MFKGQTALITGGSRGIGLALARSLAQEGANITLLAKNESLLRQSVNQLPKIENDQSHSYKVFDLLELLKPDLKNIDLNDHYNMLVNCAGISNYSLFLRTPKEDIYNTINLNLTAPIILSQLISKKMLRNKHEKHCILNVSSILSLTNTYIPGTSVYAASKAGLLGFTTSLATELQGRIRVNAIMPGLVKETDIGSKAVTPLLPITLEEVIDKAMEILKDESMNGACVEVDHEENIKKR